ncbi:hypothetical protein A4S06_01335 [Erysipelotrichaceae bacterium MTC7]|nr:hypothetical protein A4S06_01335 [Erysipelotrichaceae bacterium MTC7]
MVLVSWKNAFASHLLARGEMYFKKGLVSTVERKGDRYEANVYGTSTYDTSVVVSDELLTDAKCSCPSFKFGNLCKHLAALLFELEDAKVIPIYVDMNLKVDIFVEKDKTSTNYARYKLRKENPFQKIQKRNAITNLHTFEMTLESIHDSFIDYDEDYIDDEASEFYAEEVLEETTRSVYVLLEENQIRKAYELVMIALKRLSYSDASDAFGYLEQTKQAYCELLYQVIHKASIKEKKELLMLIDEFWKDNICTLDDVYVIALLEEAFDELLIRERLHVLENFLMSYVDENRGYRKNEVAVLWFLALEKLLTKIGHTYEIDRIYEQYSKTLEIKVYRFWQLLEQRKDEQLISYLEQEVENFDFIANIVQYANQIKACYKRLKRENDYYVFVQKILFDLNVGDYTMYRDYRSQVSLFWWEHQGYNMVKKLKFMERPRVYIQEGMYDLLLDYARGLPNQEMDYYVDILKEIYPQELLEYYEQEFIRLSTPRTNEYGIPPIIHTLRMLQRIDGGKQKAKKLIQIYAMKYPNRKRLNQEMQVFENQYL